MINLKKLINILFKAPIKETIGSLDIDIQGLAFDSRKVNTNFAFIAIKGLTVDGHNFIDKAIEHGAKAIICEKLPLAKNPNTVYVKVSDSNEALAIMAANYYDNPSNKLKLIGITGTNGKTTTVNLLHQLFLKLGYKTGVLSTVKNKINEKEIEAHYTTPDALELNFLLNLMVEEGCEYCFMEVSSHAVVQKRVKGLKFSGGIFSNITHDHLDYHKTFQEYLKAKMQFFSELPQDAFALTNADDKNGDIILQNSKVSIKKAYSLKNMSDFKGRIIENSLAGLQMFVDGKEVWFKLVGEFNAYNLMAIYGCAILLGIESSQALTALSELGAVEGRFDYILDDEGKAAIVDYAHTPDALENVLQTIRKLNHPDQSIITVVGCGGDRDAAKRPIMGKIASKLSTKSIFTSDNPRSEDPEIIIEQMYEGVEITEKRNVIKIVNREEAIKTAITMANSGDIILIAGKGHEKYQEIKGVRSHFDDKEIVKQYLIFNK